VKEEILIRMFYVCRNHINKRSTEEESVALKGSINTVVTP